MAVQADLSLHWMYMLRYVFSGHVSYTCQVNPFISIDNPFMPSGHFYLKSLDKSISYIRGVWLVFITIMFH